MPISHCPKCELKFTSRSEMQWHLREDHPTPRTPDSPVTLAVPRAEAAAPPPRKPARRFWDRLRHRGRST